MQNKSDKELVELARTGEAETRKAAFGDLIERHQAMARRLAESMLHDPELARELTQEAILEAYLSLEYLRDSARFKSWLYGIVLNVCRSHLRRRKAETFSLETLAGGQYFETVAFGSPELDPIEVAEQRELHHIVLRAVRQLSAANRTATLLFYYQELSLPEIAALLDISVTAVKGRLHKSRQQLKQQLWPELDLAQAEPKDNPQSASKKRNKQIKRRKNMLKVTVADVVPQAGEGQRSHYAVVLLDESGQRALPIWVGKYEGEGIALALREVPVPRPLTFSFMAKLLEASGATLEEIRIESLKDETFYAIARLRVGDQFQEVDARPSDALALALRTGSPIYAAEDVMAKAGLDVPENGQLPPVGKGLDAIKSSLEDVFISAKTVQEKSPEERVKSQQELVSFVFGGLN